MDLDTMLAEAAPARSEPLDGPDSPAALNLYQRITATPPRGLRRRRRIVLPVASAAAALAATALTLVFVSPAGTHQGGPRHATLAAWTTIKRGGLVQVTIHQLRDPQGLQSALRADGIPANVRFLPHPFKGGTGNEEMPSPCHAPRISDEANGKLQLQIMPDVVPGKLIPGSFHVYQGSISYMANDLSSGYVLYISVGPGEPTITQLKFPGASPGAVVYIQPSAIPRGIGLYLAAWAAPDSASGDGQGRSAYQLETGLVATSPQCTGS